MSDITVVTQEIAAALAESNTELIGKIVEVIGDERAQEFLQRALAVEEQGGLMTTDQSRRRTPGGVFFHMVRGGLPTPERRQIWPRELFRNRPPRPVVQLSWDEAKLLIAQVIKEVGEAKTVKVTLIGRPLKVVAQKECVVVSLKGGAPPSLPKGLPAVPEGSAITWAVFIVNKQWNKIKETISRNQDDKLIIEGYPIVGKNGVAAVMATNCKSVLTERAQREKQ